MASVVECPVVTDSYSTMQVDCSKLLPCFKCSTAPSLHTTPHCSNPHTEWLGCTQRPTVASPPQQHLVECQREGEVNHHVVVDGQPTQHPHQGVGGQVIPQIKGNLGGGRGREGSGGRVEGWEGGWKDGRERWEGEGEGRDEREGRDGRERWEGDGIIGLVWPYVIHVSRGGNIFVLLPSLLLTRLSLNQMR